MEKRATGKVPIGDLGFTVALRIWSALCVLAGAGLAGIILLVLRFVGAHLGWR